MKERQAFLLFQGKGENVVKKPKLDSQLHTKIKVVRANGYLGDFGLKNPHMSNKELKV